MLLARGVPVDQLEIDRWESVVTYCPLLHDPANYVPDTVDLTQDTEARYGTIFFIFTLLYLLLSLQRLYINVV